MALIYYLTIDGVVGDSQADGFEGAFTLGDYKIDVSSLISGTTSGGGAGKPVFSPLTVDLDLSSALAVLLKDAMTGEIIDSVELKGVTSDGLVAYDLKLGHVVITNIDDSDSGQNQLQLSYEQYRSFDLETNKADAAIPAPVVPAGNPTGSAACDYFLTIDGIAGNALANGHQGAFEVADFNLDVSALFDAATASGSGAGKPTFSPLTVDLTLGSKLAALLSDEFVGERLDSIELQGVSADGTKVYDLKLGNVFVSKITEADGHESVDFTYHQISLTTTGPQNADGSPGATTTVSFDLDANRQGVVVPDPVVPPGTVAGGVAHSFYLLIDGIAGDAQAIAGAFGVDDFNFDVSSLAGVASGGAGASKPSFSPLSVALKLGSGLTALLQDDASGQHIASVELKGLSSDGRTVYDLQLGDVFVTRVGDTGGADQLEFTYGQVRLTTTPENRDGSLGTPSTVSWDLEANKPDVSIPSPLVPAGAPTGAVAHAYFLTINGLVGDSLAAGHQGAFTVNDFSFDVKNLVDIASGGLATTGKADFSPLVVDLNLASGLTELLREVATGQHFGSIELQGVLPDGRTVYDLKLGDVFVTKIADSGDGDNEVTLDYGQISLVTHGQNTDGTLTVPSTFTWNRETNSAAVNIPAPAVPVNGHPDGAAANTYFLTIDGIAGDSTAVGHVGAFAINGFDFNVSNPASIASGGSGAGAGKATFSPLTIDLDLATGLADLLRDDATGRHIDSLELQGVSFDGQTVYDLKLGDVFVTKVRDTTNGHDELQFTYQQISVTTTAQSTTGQLGDSSTMTWNLGSNSQAVSIKTPVVPNTAPDGGAAATYFLTVDGIAGDSHANGHAGAFSIADFKFDVTNPASFVTGSGGGASKPTFSPLTIDLDLSTGLIGLLRDDILGHEIRSIELKGVTAGGTTVYDLKLGGVFINKVHDTNSDHDKLVFSFHQFSLVTTGQNTDGTPGASDTVTGNIDTNNQGVNIPTPVPGPNTPPVAFDDSALATTGIGGTASGNVLANDSDPDGDTLTVTPFDGDLAHGHLTLVANGDFSYTVTDLTGPTGSHLHDLFSYTESDGRGGSAGATLDVTLNRAPVALNVAATATTGVGGTAAGNVLTSPDPDGDTLHAVPETLTGGHGALTVNGDGTFSYTVTNLTGPSGSHLHDVFTYTESDGFAGGTATGTIDITLNRAPVVEGDLAGVKNGATAIGNVLTNDSDPDGDALSVTAINGGTVGQALAGSFGTLVLNGNGSYTYVANKNTPNQFAQDVFSFSESDGHGGTVQSSLAFSIVANGQTYIAGQPGQTLSPGNGKEIIDGSLGTQHLIGGNGADTLVGGPGDVLSGGNGPDVFVFHGAFGANEITDLANPDTIQLDRAMFGSASDLLAHDVASDGHGNAIITDPHNAANTIKLDGVSLNQLKASQFTLV